MMNLLISRVLAYAYGTLIYDEKYLFCKYVICNYTRFEDVTMDELEENGFKKEAINEFCDLLGFYSFEEFKHRLLDDNTVRLGQIRARLFGVDEEILLNRLDSKMDKDYFYEKTGELCDLMFKAKRVIIIGAIYPSSLAIEFQTDLISFGKPVIQFHHFDESLVATKDDVVLFISATGRTLLDTTHCVKEMNVDNATCILLTQNPTYDVEEHRVCEHTLVIPGRFDGIDFNYQLLTFFDLLRMQYFQRYYL